MGARPSSFAPVEKPVVPQRQWSEQQELIFGWFSTPCRTQFIKHLVVTARAGTGKTTTIIEGVNRAPETAILVCAFNKRIAEELNSRITHSGAEAKTLHALGLQAIRREWRGIPVAQRNDRAESLTNAVVPANTPSGIRKLVSMLHTKAREMCPLEPSLYDLETLALQFDYLPEDGYPAEYNLDFVVQQAYRAMIFAKEQQPTYDIGVDFADMIYLPLAWDLLRQDYDMVVVDETQDLTVAQLEVVRRVCSGRIALVGDDKQAIYGFRGADTDSLARLKRELGAEELFLTTTYRCCQSVVRKAQTLVPDIEAGKGNPEGLVDACGYDQLLGGAQAGDYILSRLNAPLVGLTLHLLKQGKRARMAGRDIGMGITSLIRKMKVGNTTPTTELIKRITAWESKMVTQYAAMGRLEFIDRTRDQAEMVREMAYDADTCGQVLAKLEWLFTDGEDDSFIRCSSVHKAKGLEANHVYILEDSFYRRGRTQEEDNIYYVAVTRAKSHLTFVTGAPGLR